MSGLLLLLVLLPALALLACWPWKQARPAVLALAPWVPLPGLVLALLWPGALVLDLPWLLLGASWVLDELNRPLLALTTGLWLLAGLYARGYLRGSAHAGVPGRERFWLLWLLTLSGNLGLLLSRDIAGFYAFFALMTFAGYGLVVFDGKPLSRRAGRVYLIMAVMGEGFILAGLLLAARDLPLPLLADLPAAIADSEWHGWIVPLLLAGYGVKAGLPVLHLWLPLAHPVAPTPASAVLSGAMIKAGVLGWLLTLPLGIIALPLGQGVVLLGLLAAFGAALVGVLQRDAKTVLAYSSVSQMGLLTVLIGLGLWLPQAWPLLLPALLFYALHHGLAKGALFLAVGVARQPSRPWWFWPAQLWPALSLAGLPLSSGAAAKEAMKSALAEAALSGLWSSLPLLLSLGGVGTTLLMARFLWLLFPRQEQQGQGEQPRGGATPGLIGPWLGLVALGGLGWWLLPGALLPGAGALLSAALLWPILAGLSLALLAVRWRPVVCSIRSITPTIPPGDVLALIEPLVARLRRAALALAGVLGRGWRGWRAFWQRRGSGWRQRLRRALLTGERGFTGELALGFLLLTLLWIAGLLF